MNFRLPHSTPPLAAPTLNLNIFFELKLVFLDCEEFILSQSYSSTSLMVVQVGLLINLVYFQTTFNIYSSIKSLVLLNFAIFYPSRKY